MRARKDNLNAEIINMYIFLIFKACTAALPSLCTSEFPIKNHTFGTWGEGRKKEETMEEGREKKKEKHPVMTARTLVPVTVKRDKKKEKRKKKEELLPQHSQTERTVIASRINYNTLSVEEPTRKDTTLQFLEGNITQKPTQKCLGKMAFHIIEWSTMVECQQRHGSR